MTLMDYAAEVNLNEDSLKLLLQALGLEINESLDVVAWVPQEAADELIGTLKRDDNALLLGEQGRMRAFLRRVRDAYTAKTSAPPPAAKGHEKERDADAEGKTDHPKAGEKRKKSEVLGQMDDGTYEQLAPQFVRPCGCVIGKSLVETPWRRLVQRHSSWRP